MWKSDGKELTIDVRQISVIIPTLNRRHTLPRAIESVLRQTLVPNEIIVVDNGSRDGTIEMVESRYPSVRILHEESVGVSAARNCGIRIANGIWLALLDSDDEWSPNKLQKQMETYNKVGSSTRLIHTNEIWKRNGSLVSQMKKHKKSGGSIFNACLPRCCISPSSSLLRRDLFDDLGYFDTNLPACEDYDLWLRICAREQVCFVDEDLIIKHGGHEDQLSQKHWAMDRFRVYALEKLIRSEEISQENRTSAIEMLIQKILVLISGGLKRKNVDLVSFYSKKKAFWVDMCAGDQNTKVQQIQDIEKELDYYRE